MYWVKLVLSALGIGLFLLAVGAGIGLVTQTKSKRFYGRNPIRFLLDDNMKLKPKPYLRLGAYFLFIFLLLLMRDHDWFGLF